MRKTLKTIQILVDKRKDFLIQWLYLFLKGEHICILKVVDEPLSESFHPQLIRMTVYSVTAICVDAELMETGDAAKRN